MKFYIASAEAPRQTARHPKRRQNCWLLERGACGRVARAKCSAFWVNYTVISCVSEFPNVRLYFRATRDWSYWMSFIPRAAIHRSGWWRIPSPQTRRVVQTRDDGRHEANVNHSNDARKYTSDSLDRRSWLNVWAALMFLISRKTWKWFERMHWPCYGFVCCMRICKHIERLRYSPDRIEGGLR